MSDKTDSLLGAAVGIVSLGLAIGVAKAVAGKEFFSSGNKSSGKEWWK